VEIRTGNPSIASPRVIAFNQTGRTDYRREPAAPANLLTQFREYFDKEAYRVRYQVYCREVKLSGFDDGNYPDGLECDEFDEQSEHFLLRHRPTGTIAGTVRVVMNRRQHEKQYFPIEYVASKELPSNCLESRGIKRELVGEVSRFILTSRFRSRRGEWRWPDGLSPIPTADPTITLDRRTKLHPILGLFRAVLMVSKKHGLQYWISGMEPRLARRLEQLGLYQEPITPVIDYFGPVRAYLSYIPDVLERLYRVNPEGWALVTDGGRVCPVNSKPYGTRIVVPPVDRDK
jgi:N-acyl amino acid synthase of PEP-CTERM/exosortase system